MGAHKCTNSPRKDHFINYGEPTFSSININLRQLVVNAHFLPMLSLDKLDLYDFGRRV